MAPLPGSTLLPRDPCCESPGVSVTTRMERAPPTDWRILKVFRDSSGEAEGMRDTIDGAGHRISATKVWVAWTSSSAGVKHLALVPACPPLPLTLLDLIPSCLGKPGFQRCECENVPGLCFLCVGCVCKYTHTLCGCYSLLLAGSPLRLPLWIPCHDLEVWL